jgi:hypothetical protein
MGNRSGHWRHSRCVWRIPARLLWPSSLACERSSVATSLPISSSQPTFGAFFRRRLLVGRLRTCGASSSLVKDSQQERRRSDSIADDPGASSALLGRRWLYLVCLSPESIWQRFARSTDQTRLSHETGTDTVVPEKPLLWNIRRCKSMASNELRMLQSFGTKSV